MEMRAMHVQTSPVLPFPHVIRSQPVPVLLTVRELDQGGIERDVAKIATHLDRSRFEPHVATFYAHGMRYEELLAAGIPVVEVPVRSIVSLETLRLANVLRRYIKQHRIQIVHSYDASGVFGLAVARLAGVPVTIGSQLSYRDILDDRTQMWLRLHDRFPDAMLANCEAIRTYMIEHEHVAEQRMELCYNGVDTTQFYPPASRPLPVSKIGTVCALRHEKNLPLLQEAFARVRHLQPELRLVLVGSGVELKPLQDNASRLGIADANDFIPATRDVPNWLRSFDVFVLPSYSEAFSNSLLEAMACGCAVVGSRVGGTPELTGSDEERGLLFESNNVEDLSRQLARLITDDALRQELGMKAAQFARESLSIEIAAERTGAMYERWLQKKAGH
jgi:glycosyltransferase involved in cell wall biosynthesis